MLWSATLLKYFSFSVLPTLPLSFTRENGWVIWRTVGVNGKINNASRMSQSMTRSKKGVPS